MADEDAAAQQPDADTPPEVRPTLPLAQESAPMLEAHAPHTSIHTWKDFFLHIVTIVIGLLIAVVLEQTVEFLHHRHQRLELQAQIHDVFEKNSQLDTSNSANLDLFRSYMVDLQKALAARRQGLSLPPAPDSDDPRSVLLLNIPGLAPYQAAKENGTVALLPPEQIRMYNRIESQGGFVSGAINRFDEAMAAVNAFNLRFDQSYGGFAFVQIGHVPDLVKLAPSEVGELQALIGKLISATDFLSARLRLFSIECRAALEGARDDNTFIDIINSALKANSKLRNLPSPAK